MENTARTEQRQHTSPLIPFSYYKSAIPDFFPSVPLHRHAEFELNFVLSGSAELICGDVRTATGEGDIILITPDTPHAIYPDSGGGQRYDTVVFSPSMLGASDNDRSSTELIRPLLTGSAVMTPVITPQHVYYKELRITAENIISCAKGSTPQLDMLMKSELQRLLWLLWESGDITAATRSAGHSTEQLLPVLEYMNEHYSEEITVSQLAELACMSSSNFMRRFREMSGMGAIEHLTHIRIQKACGLLTGTTLTAAEIAFACGFRNLSNFNRQFRRLTLLTPCGYRKRYCG